MKIAFVYDRINTWGGAERVLLALHELWPEAPFYTAVYDTAHTPWANALDVRPSFLQYFPLAKTHHELYPWLTPVAFESFSFDAFDVVVSITSAEAKHIITKPKTLHICYCLTPTRYLWHDARQYLHNPGIGISNSFVKTIYSLLSPKLRQWDRIGSARPDNYIAISRRVEERIKTYYHRSCDAIIYPPVDIEKFTVNKARFRLPSERLRVNKTGMTDNKKHGIREGYFLVVSRLVSGKRIDLIIDAFNLLGLPLVIIGHGKMQSELEKRANKNVHFITHYLTDEELVRYYGNCRALVNTADEDFGIAAVEAQSCGKPVIAYTESGLAETVQEGITGLFFSDQTSQAIVKTVQKFTTMTFLEKDCRNNAIRFSKERFQRVMKQTIEQLYLNYRAHTI